MTVPAGFAVKCFASEPDVVNPIAIDFDHRGRAYVLECLQYPTKGPIGSKGADRIRIYEDTDGDGVADKVTTFAEGLNLATGIAVGHGGVFVGEAPYLLFLQSTKGDDKADKRTVLLDGFGYQDTHETLNSFLWGPDGWLYGCHGVFTHSLVGKPGTPKDKRVPLNAGIWRYHPITQKFEVFAEGTSNPWGFDYDENGSGFLTACVIPHLFHIVPKGLYIRQAGQNFNPFAYGQIREICDHVHYFGASSHEGNIDPRRFTVGGGHAHAGCLIYQGGAYPEKWQGRVFMNNIHGSRINTDILKRNGSTYIGSHGEDFLVANDPNFRVIQLRTGPDGSVYMTDFYDPQICHNTDASIWDRSHGRIYKVVYKGTPEPLLGDLSKLSTAELIGLLKSDNSWWWRQALLILQERGDGSKWNILKDMIEKSADYRISLRALWALFVTDEFDEDYGVELLGHKSPWVRAWAVRLLGELGHKLRADTIGSLARFMINEDIRLQVAVLCQRLRPYNDTWPLLEELLRYDSHDPVIPLMDWLALETGDQSGRESMHLRELIAMSERNRLVSEFILPRVYRKLASLRPEDISQDFYKELQSFKDAEACAASLEGLLEGLRGRRVRRPSGWDEVTEKLGAHFPRTSIIGERLQEISVHFGDVSAIGAMERRALDATRGTRERIKAIQNLELAASPSSVDTLVTASAGDAQPEVRREAIRALARFDSETIPPALLAQWPKLSSDFRKDVIGLLSSRRIWADRLLEAIGRGTLHRDDLNENDVRRLLAFKDAALTAKLEKVWGKIRPQTPEKMDQQLRKFRAQLADIPADRSAGRAVFEKNCMICHRLFGKGNDVGPDLTGANRRDPEYLLINIIDPNRVVGKDYYRAVVFDKSGRLHTGLLAENTPQRLVLKSENSKLTVIPRSEIDDFKIEEKSLMPEGLPETMTEAQFRDLIAYLMEEPFLTRGLIAGPFKMALDSRGPIEEAADPLHTQGVTWKPFEIGPAGTIDMEKLKVLAPPTDSTAYVYFEMNSPRDTKTSLEIAADEDVKVWLNGKEVHRRMRSFEPQRITLDLKQGANKLLFKVHNIYGPSWLRARIADPERVLEFSCPKAP
ncbi:MAG TPA: PVC-type heme-binding CxxCH protein [Gemmataceae bacterium]|nr:PVC-type heme-binding CxxCH protein [Gemmataceae bacterium]